MGTSRLGRAAGSALRATLGGASSHHGRRVTRRECNGMPVAVLPLSVRVFGRAFWQNIHRMVERVRARRGRTPVARREPAVAVADPSLAAAAGEDGRPVSEDAADGQTAAAPRRRPRTRKGPTRGFKWRVEAQDGGAWEGENGRKAENGGGKGVSYVSD